MSDAIRLSKRMAELGLCSRSEADRLIETGQVLVDGKVVDKLGSRVTPEQQITLARSVLQVQPERVTLLLHKPTGVDAQADDALARLRPLLSLKRRSELDHSQIHPLRRHLDELQIPAALAEASSGLQLLTQDRTLAQRIARECELEFLVWTAQPITPEQLSAAISAGRHAQLKDCKISRQSEQQLRIVLRNPPVGWLGTLAEAAQLELTACKRIRIGRLALGALEAGQWRYLAQHERI